MFILAFVGIGLFASAGNGKKGRLIKLPVKASLEIKNKDKPTVQWQVTVTCDGHTYVACCFNSYVGADSYGTWMIAHLCS